MKLGIFGDLHITNKSPERRIDDFWATTQHKFEQALEIFQQEKCDIIIQPGDIVDTAQVSNIVISYVINTLKKYNTKLNITFGNHDLIGHSEMTLPSSPLSVLKAADCINLLDNINPIIFNGGIKNNAERKICIYGAGFGQSVFRPTKLDLRGSIDVANYNILVVHDSISDSEIYPGQEFTRAENFLKLYPEYDLVICGHIHKQFICKYKDRTIINAGPLMRDTIAQHIKNCHPSVVIFDTNTEEAKVIELTIEPVGKVFDLTVKPKRDNDAINKLIDALKSGNKKTAGWREILIRVLEQMKASDESKQAINECLETINVKKEAGN